MKLLKKNKKKELMIVLALLAVSLAVADYLPANNNPVTGAPIVDGPKTTDPKIINNVVQTKKPKVEVVFVLDTTGSMGGLIEAAKQKIWSIANTLSAADPAPEIRMGLIGYRDKQDSYVTDFTQLTDDIDSVYTRLMAFHADGGGDTPENVNRALNEAVTKTQWSRDDSTYRVIFLVGDAPPHNDYNDEVPYKKSSLIAAQNKIKINTIQCGTMPETTPFWKEIASIGKGRYFQVEQAGSAILYDTPYDEKIAALSSDLDSTRIYYGSAVDLEAQKQRDEKSNEIYLNADKSAVAKRSLFNASKGGEYNFLGKQELVNSITAGNIELKDIKESELPAPMQEMDHEERTEYIEQQSKKRNDIQKKIQELGEERQTYIEELVKKEKGAGKNSLDFKVYECIQEQAAENDITYSDGPEY